MATDTSKKAPQDRAVEDQQRKAKDGAVEPAPGEANPLAGRHGRGGDQRSSSWE